MTGGFRRAGADRLEGIEHTINLMRTPNLKRNIANLERIAGTLRPPGTPETCSVRLAHVLTLNTTTLYSSLTLPVANQIYPWQVLFGRYLTLWAATSTLCALAVGT